jgi:hypothetical protein
MYEVVVAAAPPCRVPSDRLVTRRDLTYTSINTSPSHPIIACYSTPTT